MIVTGDKPTLKSGVDLIIAWPNSMDYPVWRSFILKHKELFGQIYIAFTETNSGINYSEFVRASLDFPEFTFLDPVELQPGEDWRDNAVNRCLDLSTANWVWFTEQDFMPLSAAFWNIVSMGMARYDAIGYREGNRLHPSNLWVKREFINKTKRFFGVVPDQLDHFGKFYFSLRHSGASIHEMKYSGGENTTDTFYHMNGLSGNLSLVQAGGKPNYKEDEFANYLMLSLQVEPLDPRYREMCENYLRDYKQNESSN